MGAARRRVRSVRTGVAVLAVLAGAAGPADGSSATALPAGAGAGHVTGVLYGVSCAGPSTCVAVGSSTDDVTGALAPLVATRSGGRWQLATAPAPAHGTDALLNAVACPTSTVCTAVGQDQDTHGAGAVAERWDGSTWSLETVPPPAGTTSVALYDVGCPAPGSCVAVGGDAGGPAGPGLLAERWDGTRWSPVPVPPPPAATAGQLSGVDCTGVTACAAVGWEVTTAGTQLPVADVWDGRSWRSSSVGVPGGVTGGALVKVACASPDECVAVGGTTTGATTGGPLAERWDGTTWSVLAPVPVGPASALEDVSCPTPTTCTAVGGSVGTTGRFSTLAEGWDGTTWAVEPTAAGSAVDDLYGISCPTVGRCTGVGWTGPDPLVGTDRLGTWHLRSAG